MFEFKHTSKQLKERFGLRVLVAGVFILVLFGILVWRFYYLQVVRYDNLSARAESNRISVAPITPRRGEIRDRNGEVLARNYRSYTLEVVPAHAGDIDKMLDDLGAVVHIGESERRRFKRRVGESGRYTSIVLRNNLNDTEAAWFAAQSFRFPGVEIKARWVREYPFGEVAAHVIGYVGRLSEQDFANLEERGQLGNYRGTDVIGKKGLEKTWEEALHGRTGIEEVEVTARGRPVRVLRRTMPEPGRNLYLSLDIHLQKVAEDAFEGRRGALVAIEPETGDVLAFVSQPSFDPNLFIDGIDVANWRRLNESPDRPLINRPLFGTYPIGSTYKPFVALAALEMGKRKASDRMFDPGYYEFGGQRFRNAGSAAYGSIDMTRALIVSSDTYFYSLGPEIGVDALHDFMQPFGFGRLTGIDLDGEKAGVLPSREWKRRAYRDPAQQRWYAGETVSIAVGQGYNSFTLLQLAQATAVLANGGKYMTPRLVQALQNAATGLLQQLPNKPEHELGLKPENVDVIRKAMVETVRAGTARSAFANTPYQAGGKTGTAQVFSLRGTKYRAEAIDERLRDHGVFIAFAPAEKPAIAVAVLVENGGWGGRSAAPIARKVLDYWLVERPALEREAAEAQARTVQSADVAAPSASAGDAAGAAAVSPVGGKTQGQGSRG
ncbi:penicillin-binding protein 2 [Kerstersia gyiorum]|uniref:penicillin-binding protein 2 n=1 Tax=Kerstersia gyiorum TaxID=206506 RepID=UPI001070A2D1|nr:penicillin-binding protein 2 [Kerstersia gyiorum]QBR41786.1 penicillin-binding protein 2 [Kerstersia gyiorum]